MVEFHFVKSVAFVSKAIILFADALMLIATAVSIRNVLAEDIAL
jgi:hypothetical protein